MQYRKVAYEDLAKLKTLGATTWQQYQTQLTEENWMTLWNNVNDSATYVQLLNNGVGFVCEDQQQCIVGMSFVIPSGTAIDVYKAEWCQLRYVTVHPNAAGQGVGRKLVELCIEHAKATNEHTMALHTSEHMHSARYIYESLGFEIEREIDQRYGMRY